MTDDLSNKVYYLLTLNEEKNAYRDYSDLEMIKLEYMLNKNRSVAIKLDRKIRRKYKLIDLVEIINGRIKNIHIKYNDKEDEIVRHLTIDQIGITISLLLKYGYIKTIEEALI